MTHKPNEPFEGPSGFMSNNHLRGVFLKTHSHLVQADPLLRFWPCLQWHGLGRPEGLLFPTTMLECSSSNLWLRGKVFCVSLERSKGLAEVTPKTIRPETMVFPTLSHVCAGGLLRDWMFANIDLPMSIWFLQKKK